MSLVKIKYKKNQAQEEFHRDDSSKFLMFNGGLGCLKEDSKVSTASGPVPISDIKKSNYLLTLDHSENRFAFQTSSGAFPKGKDYFYRVISEHGEFSATARHQIFSSNYTYQHVGNLNAGDEVLSCSQHPYVNDLESFQKLYISGVLDSLNTILGFLNHCLGHIRQYDRQLLSGLNIDLMNSQLPSYAREYGHIFCPLNNEREDDLLEQIREHTHLYQSTDRADMPGCIPRQEALALVLEGQASSTIFEHTLQDNLRYLLSLDFSLHHPKDLLFLIHRISFLLACTTSNATNYNTRKSRIISIEKQSKKDWVWDIAVPNTNNYIADGFIHHNSGKTFGLCMKLIKLSALNKNIAGGCLAPSFPMYKKDILPTFQEIINNNGLYNYTKFHKTDHYIIFPWTTQPLYFFTAEKDIKGPNLGYGGINEHSSIPLERVNQFIQRIRVKSAPVRQLCFAGTPEDEYAWLDDFVEKHEESGMLRIINGKTTENEHLAPEYIENLRATLDPLAFRLFAEGEMLKLTGNQFYYAYGNQNLSDMEFDRDYSFFVNIDFNVGNMHATVAQKYENKKGEKVSIFCDEIVLKHNGADTYALIDEIRSRYTGILDNMLITCDASGRNRKTTGLSDVQALKQAFGEDAVRYRASGNPRMRKKQLLINGLLSNALVLVNKKKCPKLHKDLSKVMQKEDFTKDDKNKEMTHASDTLDYYCDFEYTLPDRTNFTGYKAR